MQDSALNAISFFALDHELMAGSASGCVAWLAAYRMGTEARPT
jgi:hypothetical protein